MLEHPHWAGDGTKAVMDLWATLDTSECPGSCIPVPYEMDPSIPEGENYLWHTSAVAADLCSGYRTRYWPFLPAPKQLWSPAMRRAALWTWRLTPRASRATRNEKYLLE